MSFISSEKWLNRLLLFVIVPAFAVIMSAQVRVEPSFTSCSIYVPADAPGKCRISYRKVSEPAWNNAFEAVYDLTHQEHRVSLVRLDENTSYEVRVEREREGGKASVESATFRTWSSNVPVHTTRKLSSFRSGSAPAIKLVGLKGSPEGWIKIMGDIELHAGDQQDSAILVEDCQYVIIEGATIRGGRLHGILIRASSSHIRIVNCDISKWGRNPGIQARTGQYVDAAGKIINNDAGVAIDRAGNIVVERCYIHDPNGYTNPWNGVIRIGEHAGQPFSRAHPVGPNGVYVRQSTGGVVIRYNDITGSQTHRYNDPIETSSNGAVDGGFNKDADIHGNLLAFGEDDGIELDGGQCNVRFFNNRVEQVLCGISTAPNKKGPSYIFNNLVWNLGDSNGRTGAGIKNGGGIAHSLGRQFFFNNTIISNGYGIMQGVGFGEAGANHRELYHAYSRNNIFMMVPSPRRSGRNSGVVPSINDKHKLSSNSFDHDVIANSSAPDGRGVIIAAEGNEQNGIFGLPAFTDAAHGVFSLEPSDHGVDRGVVVPNFTGRFAGAAPDIGALERGASTLMPIRPLNVSADKYYVRLKDGEPQRVILEVGEVAGNSRFTVRKSEDMDWLDIEPLTGTLQRGTAMSITLKVRSKEETNQGMIFVRLDNGLSVPITVTLE